MYDLVVRRFIAAFYPDCEISTTTVLGKVDKVDFKVTGKQILKPGWRVVFGAEQKERFAALGFDVRSDKMPDLKELLERFDQMTKPQLPTNWLMRLTTKRYLRAYPHLQGTHHASLKKEEKKVEEKEEKK